MFVRYFHNFWAKFKPTLEQDMFSSASSFYQFSFYPLVSAIKFRGSRHPKAETFEALSRKKMQGFNLIIWLRSAVCGGTERAGTGT